MDLKSKQKPNKRLPALVCIISLIFTIALGLIFLFLWYQYWHSEQLITSNAISLAKQEASSAQKKIDEGFKKFAQATEETANQLSDGKLTYSDIAKHATQELDESPTLYSVTIAFKPFKYENRPLYALFFEKEGTEIKQKQLDTIYDYTLPTTESKNKTNTDWYRVPLEKNSSMWLEPYYGKAAQRVTVDYVAPFYLPNQPHTFENQAGVIVYSANLSGVNKYIASMLLGNTSYGYIISKNGLILLHPIEEKVGTTIKHQPQKTEDYWEYIDQKTGKSFWQFTYPLNGNDWLIIVNLDKQDFLLIPKIKLHHLSWMVVTGVLTLLFLFIIVFRVYKANTSKLWLFSIASSILFVIGIAFLWHFYLNLMQPPSGTKVMDKAALNRYLLLYSDINKAAPEIYIPTGILIKSIYFPSQNRIGISGYLWQKYPKNIDLEKSAGFLLPMQAGLTSIKQVSKKIDGSQQLIVWFFDTNLRQAMNPFAYPLDSETLSIPLIHANVAQNFILVPDLDAYEALHSDNRPGLDKGIFLEDWVIGGSFFSYVLGTPNSYFGLNRSEISTKIPELRFNISIKRNILNPIFSYLVPLFLVVFMFFAVVMSEKVAHIVSFAGAMLIVIAVAHVALRDKIAVQGLSYLESFYIVIYPMIVAVSMNFLLKSSSSKIHFLQLRTHLITKLLFWPIILATYFIIALLMFGFI